MGAFNDYLTSIKGSLAGQIEIGGTFVGTSEGVPLVLAQQIKGGLAVLDSLDTLADMPYQLLQQDMEIVVKEYNLVSGTRHPRTKYILKNMPPADTKVNEVGGYVLGDYWITEASEKFTADVETQYAPNFEGKRPLFLPGQISSAAYQAGFPNDATYNGGAGNPADKIWVTNFNPTLGHAWVRQRITGSSTWGIPISLNAGGDYEDGQYIDTIFIWITPKGAAAPAKPVQPSDYLILPTGWAATPGANYAVDILTKDLYRSDMLRNPYGVPKSDWSLPLLISSDPNLVRYGNTPGNTDFLNDTYWRGYYTPGLDTHMATRTDSGSSNWTVTKIDQEAGEFPDFVFKNFPIGTTLADLTAAIPTAPYPVGGTFPNDAFDAPPAEEENKIRYMSTSTKYSDGSLKKGWSLWRRFDGLNSIVAVLESSPGDTFVLTRNAAGALVYTFANVTLTAKLYSGNTEVLTGFTTVKWYKGATLIIFDPGTRLATNLGASYNAYHQVSVDGKSLTIAPEGFDDTQQYRVGITHVTRPSTDYEASVLLKDTTDDGSAYVADINSPDGTTFKNTTGLKQFVAKFYKGGLDDAVGVVFTWTIRDAAGVVIAGGLRNSAGVSVGDLNYAAAEVYVNGSDISQIATLELTAVFGGITRTDIISLTDVADAEAPEALYWGTGISDPGSPTDFADRTLTKAQVLALGIGYQEDATGTWYMIMRINGVWGGEIQMRSESARPNGGISLPVYKNVDFAVSGAPAAPAVPAAGSIIPAGWTQAPTAFTGSQDRQYTSVCFFLLRTDVAADPTTLTRDNYTPLGTYSTPYVSGVDQPPASVAGAPGDDGWSPLLAVKTRSSDGAAVLKVVGWFGGEGTVPASDTTTSYITATGLGTIDNAVAINGPAGAAANVRPQYYKQVGSSGPGTPNRIQSTTSGAPVAETAIASRLIITNTHTEPRIFVIRGEMAYRETSGVSIVVLRLYGGTISDPNNPPASSITSFTKRDYHRDVIDINDAPSNEGVKLEVGYTMTIQPGASAMFFLTSQKINGNALQSSGYMEAWGL